MASYSFRYSYLMASSLINYSACGLYLGMGENFLEVKDKRGSKELSPTTSLNPVLRSRTALASVVAGKVSGFYNCASVCLSASLVLSWTACPGFYRLCTNIHDAAENAWSQGKTITATCFQSSTTAVRVAVIPNEISVLEKWRTNEVKSKWKEKKIRILWLDEL